MTTLLQDIEAFLTKHEMGPTVLGHMALNDKHFVKNLREGRRVWPETEEKVRDFMAGYEPAADAA